MFDFDRADADASMGDAPCPEPAIIVARAVMRGERTLLEGRTGAWLEGERVGLRMPDGAVIELRAPGSPVRSFSCEFAFDLTRSRLSDIAVECSGYASERLRVSRIDADLSGSSNANRDHLETRGRDLGRTKPFLRDLYDRFESLGDNCEFGVFGDRFEIIRPSLFRFGGTAEFKFVPRRSTAFLGLAIENFLEGLGEIGDLEFSWHGEWIATSRRYAFLFHTGDRDRKSDLSALAQRMKRRLAIAVRVFVEHAANPATIFVRKSNGADTESDIRSLHAALRTLGRANLLWVDLATSREPVGCVSLLGDGLYKACIETFRPYGDAGLPDRPAWLQVITDCWIFAEGVGMFQTN